MTICFMKIDYGSSDAVQTVPLPTAFRYCIALKDALFFRQPSGVELRRSLKKSK
jgi:hypothetical protein